MCNKLKVYTLLIHKYAFVLWTRIQKKRKRLCSSLLYFFWQKYINKVPAKKKYINKEEKMTLYSGNSSPSMAKAACN